MLIETLVNLSKEIKNFSRIKKTEKNREEQKLINLAYNEIVAQFKTTTEQLEYVSKNFHFIVSTDTKGKIIKALNLLNIADGCPVSKEIVSEAKKLYADIQKELHKEWQSYCKSDVCNTVNTLKILRAINPSLITPCIIMIEKSYIWKIDLSTYEDLKKALNNANDIINGLNLDNEIVVFLSKMAEGKITLADLNTKVMSWIRAEALEGKIKLNFSTY